MLFRYINNLFDKLGNKKKDDAKIIYARIHLIIFVFVIGFSSIAIKLLSIAIFNQNNDKIVNISDKKNKRADILDRNGILIASNLTTASIYANPNIILNVNEAANKLCGVLPDLNCDQLVKDLESKKNFIWIKRNLTPKEQQSVNNLGIPGIFFEKGEKRIYPHRELLAHILGYVGLDGRGLAGIEKYMDNELSDGRSQLNLSIDISAQNIVHEELLDAIAEYKAIGAIGIIADAKCGEIISAVSLPDYDPHSPAIANSEQLFNRFSLGLYEPGSTFKSYTMAMALDTKTIDLDDFYDVNAPIRAARFNITDYHAKGGLLSVPEIFMYSSNIGTAKISLDLGKKRQQSLLKLYGLLENLNIELPEKSYPIYPNESKWSDISTMTISYGHGIAVTPLHMIRTMAAVVNGGILTDLTLIKGKEKNNIKIIKEETSKQMRKLFRLVVTEGTGRKADVKGYLVGGKTGTPNKTKSGKYSQNARMSSFIGAWPINDPKYVILVMLDEPKGTKATSGYATGGMTAAPVVGKIISRIGPLLNIPIIDENDIDIINDVTLDRSDIIDELSSF